MLSFMVLISWLQFVHSCCCIVWRVSSVFGVYHPVSILGRRSLLSPGDLMAKVRNDHLHCFFLDCWLLWSWGCYTFILSIGLQPRRHQAGGPVWCGESRDSTCVSDAEPSDLHALDGGDGGEQVCVRHRDQTRGTKDFSFSRLMWIIGLFVCVSVLSAPFTIQKMNPNFFFPNYQHSPRGNSSIIYMSDFNKANRGLTKHNV